MKNIIFILVLLLISCVKDNKYTLTIKSYSPITHNYINSKPKTIMAPNDSVAYIKAYEHYCYFIISEEILSNGQAKGPRNMKLLDKNFHEIKNKGYLTQTQKDNIFRIIKERNKDLYK